MCQHWLVDILVFCVSKYDHIICLLTISRLLSCLNTYMECWNASYHNADTIINTIMPVAFPMYPNKKSSWEMSTVLPHLIVKPINLESQNKNNNIRWDVDVSCQRYFYNANKNNRLVNKNKLRIPTQKLHYSFVFSCQILCNKHHPNLKNSQELLSCAVISK